VVRGRVMAYPDVVGSAEVHHAKTGRFASSAFSTPGLTSTEIALAAGSEWLPHSKIRKSTVGTLRFEGFDVRRTPPPEGHVDIDLPHAVTEAVYATLDEAFDAPEANPVARGRADA